MFGIQNNNPFANSSGIQQQNVNLQPQLQPQLLQQTQQLGGGNIFQNSSNLIQNNGPNMYNPTNTMGGFQIPNQNHGLLGIPTNNNSMPQLGSGSLLNNPTNFLDEYITSLINTNVPPMNNNLINQNNIGIMNQPMNTINIPQLNPVQNIIRDWTEIDQNMIDILKIAFKNPTFYNDERDDIIKRLNILCCYYGCSYVLIGRGYPAVSITPKNPLCKFKFITYLPRFKYKDKDGIITMDIAHPLELIQSCADNFLGYILQLIATKIEPDIALTIKIHDALKLDDKSTRIIFCVNYKDNTGVTTNIGALKLCDILNTDVNNQLLGKQGVIRIDTQSDFTSDLEEHYRKYPPYGTNVDVWNEAFENNPNPSLYIPYVLLGFKGVSERVQVLRNQAQELMDNINNLSTKFNENKSNYFSLNIKLNSYSNVISNLVSRVLKLYCLRERINRSSEPLMEYEEKFKLILKNLCSKIVDLQELKDRIHRSYDDVQKRSQIVSNIKPTMNDMKTSCDVKSELSIEHCDPTTVELLFKHLNKYNLILTKLVQSTKKDVKTIERISTILHSHEFA